MVAWLGSWVLGELVALLAMDSVFLLLVHLGAFFSVGGSRPKRFLAMLGATLGCTLGDARGDCVGVLLLHVLGDSGP
jgi:hypothetical protein